jgi:hypothetical protein
MKDQPPIFNRYQHLFIYLNTQAEPRKLSSLTLYIDLWQEGKPAPGQNPPVISPPVVIFRRIGVCAEIRTQNPVLSNTRLVKMVPLSHLRRHPSWIPSDCVTFLRDIHLVTYGSRLAVSTFNFITCTLNVFTGRHPIF